MYTLKAPVYLEGVGLHSGVNTSVTIRPSEKEGICFSLGGSIYPIESAIFKGDGRGSELIFPSGSVKTVEHLMASISGLNLTDVVITVDGGEVPAMDGSSLCFCRSFYDVGTTVVKKYRDPLAIDEPLYIDDQEGKRTMVALPSDKLRVTYMIDYGSTSIGTQSFSCDISPDYFFNEIAPCRTFALMDEVEYLRSRGLAQGGSLKNCVVVDGPEVLAEGGLRFKDEFVRHKILDLIGDIALLGRPVMAHFVALRAGHAVHQGLVKRLRELTGRFSG